MCCGGCGSCCGGCCGGYCGGGPCCCGTPCNCQVAGLAYPAPFCGPCGGVCRGPCGRPFDLDNLTTLLQKQHNFTAIVQWQLKQGPMGLQQHPCTQGAQQHRHMGGSQPPGHRANVPSGFVPCRYTTVGSSAGLTAVATACTRTVATRRLGDVGPHVRYPDPVAASHADQVFSPPWPCESCILSENLYMVVSMLVFILLSTVALIGFLTP
ncbi:unnamed protein product [Chrysodeixis includens]|uniref:Uncharacterized protein n=1 Tax=Chrysodeixis includens TaxID=689277 RepID=A0A9N8PY12_CHRIL|nr:unnamed protein product [Chrysodeixis includens]